MQSDDDDDGAMSLMQTGPPGKKSDHPWTRHRTVSLIIRSLIGVVFIYAGSLKLTDPASFAWNIYQYGLVPRDFIDILAIGLPAIEILAGIGLLFNGRGSQAIIAGLLTIFMLVLGYALLNGLSVDCGCFPAGEPGPAGLRKALLRDVLMIIGIGYVYWFSEEIENRGKRK